MGQVLHGSARTTAAVRRAIQQRQERRIILAQGKRRTSVPDLPPGPTHAKSPTRSSEEEAIIVAFRRQTVLPLDDCLYAGKPRSHT